MSDNKQGEEYAEKLVNHHNHHLGWETNDWRLGVSLIETFISAEISEELRTIEGKFYLTGDAFTNAVSPIQDVIKRTLGIYVIITEPKYSAMHTLDEYICGWAQTVIRAYSEKESKTIKTLQSELEK